MKENNVLWNNEMNLCIGLTTELDEAEFIEEAKNTYKRLTGDELQVGLDSVKKVQENHIWWLEH